VDGSKRRRGRSPRANAFFNGLAIAISILSLGVSSVTAYATFAQVQAIQESTTEKLVLMGMTSGILEANYEDVMGEPSDRPMSSINDNDVVSVWLDVSNNGRAAGSITEMSYVVLGEQFVPVVQVKCGSRNEGTAEDCVLPIPLDQGEQVRIRVDFDLAARAALNCPNRVDYFFITLTDAAGRDLNVGEEYEEPAWDCTG
jgi:hypothetical protein